MKKILIVLLLLAHFLKQLFWLGVIPIWHFPDEEQHFANVAFQAEKGFSLKGTQVKNDVNQEIDISSELLGTKRDQRGINKFTYHPEFKIPYLKEETGLHEKEITNLNNQENRQTMVKKEAARYDPAYYFLDSLIYKFFYQDDLFVRVFSSRFLSVILSTLTVFIVYLISKEIFKKEYFRLALTFLVAFQPMFSFVSAGVSSDNLFNLVFTLIIYACLKLMFIKPKLLIKKENLFYFFLLILSLFIGLKTKKQIIIALPIIFLSFLLSLFKRNKKARKISIGIIASGVIIYLIATQGKIDIPEYNPGESSKLAENLWQYLLWHLQHTVAETIPWYWGVFNWLGVTLPRWVNQVQARLLIISSLGLLIFFLKQIKSRKLKSPKNLKIFFLLVAAAIYYFAIIFWDYFFRQSHGFSFGIQGRYFFPTIVSHMFFILLGLLALIPKKFKLLGVKILMFWWFIFSLIGLKTAVSSYYQLWPISVFLSQASQYKPIVFKSAGLLISFVAFITAFLIFLFNFLRIKSFEKK
ncbi:hypothetical protein COT75_02900 [Candidatus Beckwithbacteria bacterium CG10_big_fil_rev_8_21_14_0_10_34_10]|uniref:Glycosyltransferase RgtA/B/C/D-like domain-containing protein n=1 Tax=Candidatus Beckwithbacteria bacterium CG10_big_fil_rev_8_21_14_0_10_34_10 TaxID=1974495 RepID=A0A2H0W950_9BACT|nr:MAG: hypothetical protein COT75_02900 [Candidatus Beckwithbacteria bacterium CG10_big_fil_rev_8_21_14_0_10_34_10]